MGLIFIKFIEVFARATFVIATSYSLSLAGAGQFGIAVTLVGLFAFAFNWERQVDIQRRYVNAPPEIFDRAVMAALPFWGFNQLVMMPILLAAGWWLGHLDTFQLVLLGVIASCEHVANQTYQMALISRRYWQFLYVVAGKNVVVLLAVLPFALLAPSMLTLDYVLSIWTAGQLVCAVVVFAILWRVKRNVPHETAPGFKTRIGYQHRDSLVHFQIGLIAIVMLQYDRLVAGALLPLDDVGVYFRHLLAVSFIYQFFNVASYNRLLPAIFASARTVGNTQLIKRLGRELGLLLLLVSAAFAAGIAIDYATGHVITEKYHLSVGIAAVLVAGAMIRVAADFGAMLCNARMAEKRVVRAQLVALGCGAPLLVVLALCFGVAGAALASATTSAVYLLVIAGAVRSLPGPEETAV